MNEWAVSILVTMVILIVIGLFLWLKENRKEILAFIFGLIFAIVIIIGLINMVHEFIYGVLPAMRGG